MRNILITGSLGLVGSACVDFFKKKEWEVVGIDANMRAYFFGTQRQSFGDTLNIDIRNRVDIDELFEEHKFDAIIHTAAQPSHDWAKDHVMEDFSINATGTLVLLEAARKYCPDAVFVYVSTDKVYGENMQTPLEEKDTRMEPIYMGIHGKGFNESLGLDFAGQRSLFGCSKTAADIYAQEYMNYFGMKIGIFRPGCITGKNHQGAEYHGFLAYLVKCIKEGKTYKIFGHKGKQVRDQIHATDIASAFWHFIEDPKPGVYNMGGGPERSVSVLEAGGMISRELIQPFLFEDHEPRKGDRIWDVHDISKFRTTYPKWDYTYDLPAIIKDLCS